MQVHSLPVFRKAPYGLPCSVAFRSNPEYAIVIKIHKDGTFSEIYNGRGSTIWDTFKNRKLPSNGQYQISLTKLKELSKKTPSEEKIPSKISSAK